MRCRPTVEVVKVGGSLLQRADFTPSLECWLATSAPRAEVVHRVLLVGGGEAVNELRARDAEAPLGDDVAHWRAIALMHELGESLARSMPALHSVATLGELLPRLQDAGDTLLLPQRFLEVEEPGLPGTTLPVGWHVTSDSIAARLAIVLGAARLRLLKSRSPTRDEARSWARAAEGGFVDGYFPELAGGIAEVRCELLPPPISHLAGRAFVDTRGGRQVP